MDVIGARKHFVVPESQIRRWDVYVETVERWPVTYAQLGSEARAYFKTSRFEPPSFLLLLQIFGSRWNFIFSCSSPGITPF